MSTTVWSDPRPAIQPHQPLPRLLHTGVTALYVLVKWAVSPFLYVARRLGLPPAPPRRLDAAINRACLPLTESPDAAARLDVRPALQPGDLLPDVNILLSDGTPRSLGAWRGRPLLLVLVRGDWCSYSRLHLADVAAAAPRLEAEGIAVLAVASQANIDWWRRHGINVPLAADPDGVAFDALGVRVRSWLETAWGRVLPHESAFLFDAAGRLVTADVRRVSSIRPGQRFLGADRWLALAAHSLRRTP